MTTARLPGRVRRMSFQAYLDAVEAKTGRTPADIVELARAQGFERGSRGGPVVAWLKAELGIGHGHAQALAHVITKGPTISARHVGTDGSHRDDSTELRLDGIAAR